MVPRRPRLPPSDGVRAFVDIGGTWVRHSGLLTPERMDQQMPSGQAPEPVPAFPGKCSQQPELSRM